MSSLVQVKAFPPFGAKSLPDLWQWRRQWNHLYFQVTYKWSTETRTSEHGHHWKCKACWYTSTNTCTYITADSRLAPSQWETPLKSNVISHWRKQIYNRSCICARPSADTVFLFRNEWLFICPYIFTSLPDGWLHFITLSASYRCSHHILCWICFISLCI